LGWQIHRVVLNLSILPLSCKIFTPWGLTLPPSRTHRAHDPSWGAWHPLWGAQHLQAQPPPCTTECTPPTAPGTHSTIRESLLGATGAKENLLLCHWHPWWLRRPVVHYHHHLPPSCPQWPQACIWLWGTPLMHTTHGS